MPALNGIDGDNEFLGFKNPSVEFASECGEPPPFIIGLPDSFLNQAFEDSCLFIQQVYDEIELPMNSGSAGDDMKGGFIVDVWVVHAGQGRVGRRMRRSQHSSQGGRSAMCSSGGFFHRTRI